MERDATTEVRARIKRVIVESLMLEDVRPEDIGDREPLFGEGLGLDSVDALELVLGVETEFGIQVRDKDVQREAFRDVESLAGFVERARAAAADRPAASGA